MAFAVDPYLFPARGRKPLSVRWMSILLK